MSSGETVYLKVRGYSSSTTGSYTVYASKKEPDVVLLSNGTGRNGTIAAGDEYIYQFTAPSAGTYVFYTTGSMDTYGHLYSNQSLSSQISTDDDSGENRNFKIEKNMSSGETVYLKVRGYSSSTTGSYTVYASRKYVVSYNANGGSGAPSSQTKVHGESLTLSTTQPAKAYTITYNANGEAVGNSNKTVSCTFRNWNTSANGSGNSYGTGSSFTANTDITLYAQWGNPTAGTLATPTRSGYTFAGWYTSASGGSQVTSNTTITGNTIIYAHWNQNLNLTTPVLAEAVNAVTGVTVKWNKVTGAEGYYVYRKNGSNGWKRIGTVNGNNNISYADKTPVSGTTYTYTVRAYSGSKMSGYDAAGKTVKYLSAPILSSVVNDVAGVIVKWEKVTGADSYNVYRKNGSSGWKRVATVSGGNTINYVDETVATGTTYTYTVRACSGNVLSSYDASGKSVKYLSTPILSDSSNATTGVTVKWGKVAGANGYYVYRKSGTGNWSKIGTVNGESIITYTDTQATSGTTYTYTVRAYSGNTMSSYDKTGKSIKRLSQPTLSSASYSNSGVTVKWSKVSGATGYYVYRKTVGGSWSKIASINSSSTISYTDSKVSNNTTYYYTVRAVNGNTLSYYDTAGLVVTTVTEGNDSVKADMKMTVAGKTYYIGQSVNALGTPVEKITSAYGFTWYVYGTSTYKDFFVAGIADGKVVALASSGAGFTYQGMRCGNRLGSYVQSNCFVIVATDRNDNNIVHGVFIRDRKYSESGLLGKVYTSNMLAGESKMNFYFTNAFRVYHGKKALQWSEKAAKAAQLHSQDMANQNYFAHNSLDGRTPEERMRSQGIGYRSENIIAGYYTGFDAYNGWVNSSGHRNNILNNSVVYLGVGGGYQSGSDYRVYFTQDFYN